MRLKSQIPEGSFTHLRPKQK